MRHRSKSGHWQFALLVLSGACSAVVMAEQDELVAKTEIAEESDTEFVELLEFLGQLSTENGNWLEQGVMAEVWDGNESNQTDPSDKRDKVLRKEPTVRPGY